MLDLEGARIWRDIGLKDCRFDAVPVLRYAVIDNLLLDGSSLPGLQLERLEARGGVSLKSAELGGEVRLSGSRLGGNLSLDGASFSCAGRAALVADGIDVRSVELRGAAVAGETRMTSARINGDLDLTGPDFPTRTARRSISTAQWCAAACSCAAGRRSRAHST